MGITSVQSDQRYLTLVTDLGKAKIATSALDGGTVNIIEAAVGDGGGAYYRPTPEQTELVREVWRGQIANRRVNPESPNMIDLKVVIPADVGGWTIREIGLFDTDGDLICVTNTPDTEKALITTGATASLGIILHILFADIDSVTVTVNPAVDQVTANDVEIIVRDAIAAYARTATAVTKVDITIPVVAWTQRELGEGGDEAAGPDQEWRFEAEVACYDVLGTQIPVATLKPVSFQAALNAGLYPGVETADGIIRFWAQEIPLQDLEISVVLLSRGGSGSGSGGDQYIPDIAVATDEEIGEMIYDVFGGSSYGEEISSSQSGAVASDSEFLEMMEDVFDNNSSNGIV